MASTSQFWVLLTLFALVSSYEDYYSRNFENQGHDREQDYYERNREHFTTHPTPYSENRNERREELDPYRSRSDLYSGHPNTQSELHRQETHPYRTSSEPYSGHFNANPTTSSDYRDTHRQDVDPYHTRSGPYTGYPSSHNENHDKHRQDIDPYGTRSDPYYPHPTKEPTAYSGSSDQNRREGVPPYQSSPSPYEGYHHDPYARSHDSSTPNPQPYDYNTPSVRDQPYYAPYATTPMQTESSYDRYHQQYDPRKESQRLQDHVETTPDPYRYNSYGFDPYATQIRGHESQPKVNIPSQGTALGTIGHTSWTGRSFYKFLGIKYAHVGRGYKRFQKADPVQPWRDEFNATVEPQACPSFPNLNKIQRLERSQEVEDCLSVSIYTPDLQGRHPVMFYIHGEFFFDGNSQEAQPDYLLEKDVVLVSVEYRLGPFGFLSTLTERLPGNTAVTDVIAALEWVHNNIVYFGGDPGKVTIFGQGAGASMAHLLSISPYVKTNLFHQVILQSGTAFNPYLLTSDPVKHTRDIARRAGCATDTLDDIADCLSKISTSEVLRAFLRHCQENEPLGVGHYGGFQLVIGDYYGIIPSHPYKLASQYDGVNYLIIGGVTKDVGSFFFSKIFPYIQRSPRKDLDSLIDIVLKHTLGDEDEYGIWKNLIARELFTEEQRSAGTLEAFAPGLIDLVSAVLYKAPLLETLQQNAKFDPNGTYLYSFDYEGKHKRYRFPSYPFDLGVTLSDDNIYLFPYPDYVASLDEEDQETAQDIVDLWTSFATTGIPRTRKLKEWPQMHLVTGPYINIGGIDNDIDLNDDFVGEFSASQFTAVAKIMHGLAKISDLFQED